MELDIKDVIIGVSARIHKYGNTQVRVDKIQEFVKARLDNPPTFGFTRQGNFTMATLFDPLANKTFMGIAKKAPMDAMIPIRGRALALSRAVRQMFISELELDTNQ